MLFHTWPFAVFLLVVVPVFFALRRTRLWLAWLTLASYVFYGWWNPYYLLLVAYSTLLDYALVALMDRCPGSAPDASPAGRPGRFGLSDPVLRAAFIGALAATLMTVATAIFGPPTLGPTLAGASVLLFLMALGALFRSRGLWLVVSLVNNLALLLFFKYARFLAENLNAAFASLHWNLHLPDPSALMPFGAAYLLPAGISFFTFQSLSYTIDFYHGRVERERSLLRFATFVCFFPQLMAGPIERARNLLPQFHRFPPVERGQFAEGASLFLAGLFKKLALANYLSAHVERVFERPQDQSSTALLVAAIAFGWQIYFDFSGYTDMARGVARILGFKLMLNFNSPYLATSLGEFWTRWHISLSSWFRDYVYIPLGGNRAGAWATRRNLLITFVISGIWHGAAWNFLIWGLLHGVGVVVNRELERSAFFRDRVPTALKRSGVFAFVMFTWVFFRTESVADALTILRRIGAGVPGGPQIPALLVLLVGAYWLHEWLSASRFRTWITSGPVRVATAVFMIAWMLLGTSGGGAFIYFQF
jgi:alginate O-acetyltransferase complex protein AlgI